MPRRRNLTLPNQPRGAVTAQAEIRDRSLDLRKDITNGRVRYSVRQRGQQANQVGIYRKGQQIGRGAFSTVFQMFYKQQLFVAKVCKQPKKKKQVSVIQNQIKMLKRLHHRYILPLYEIIDDLQDSRVYLITQYCAAGSLLSARHKTIRPQDFSANRPNALSQQATFRYFRMALEAIRFLHCNGIAHQDIKPQNILIMDNGVIRLADFGLATVVDRRAAASLAGTPFYLAPQRFTAPSYCPHASDMWALGVTFYLAVTGQFPFKGKSLSQLKDQIVDKEINMPQWIPKNLSSMLDRLLKKEEAARSRARQFMFDETHDKIEEGDQPFP